ncbi:MAG: glycosyltransferase family 2 protein [Candidatus Promineifilaceae bacterium]|nr:glycosyltransferase family 2 protein [Candidatus Promineifilaceae bacterium]
MNDPFVYVVIASWNGRQHLKHCLPSLRTTNYANFRVLVVDDGSTDGTVEWLRQHHPEVECLRLSGNEGFVCAANRGMQEGLALRADYLLLLNNDTRVTPDWIDELVNVAEKDDTVGICSGRQLSWSGEAQIELRFYPEFAAGRLVERDVSDPDPPHPVAYGDGCCMLLRRQLLSAIGLFDDRYVAYAEDVDLSLRAWTSGWKVMHVPAATIHHRVGGSKTVQQAYLGYRNQLTTAIKVYQPETLWRFRVPMLQRWLLTRYPPALKATRDALRMARTSLSLRRGIQAERKLTDDEVFEQFTTHDPALDGIR